jgi:predicted nucleic acid-binding protein
MIQVSLDTSFLISFADPSRPNHTTAVDYYRHCQSQRIPMVISTIAAGEFEVGQRITDLPLQNFRIQPYNLPHAIKAAVLMRALRQTGQPPEERRAVIINDLKLIAQADEDAITVIITEDRSTLAKMVERLREASHCNVRVILLSDGFTPGRLTTPDQSEFPLRPETP